MRDTPVEDIPRPVTTHRQEVDHKLELVKTKAEAIVRRHGGVATGVALTALAVLGLGIIVRRRHEQQSLAKRMHAALDWSVPELPEAFVKGLKRPMRRAMRAL